MNEGAPVSHNVLVSVFCPDRTGLIADMTGALFDLGANLGDANFAVLGGGAEFTAVCEIPDSLTGDDLAAALQRVPDVANGKLSIAPFTLEPLHGETGRITHRVTVRGGDRPGLIARLAEAFVEFDANVVRLSSEKTPDGNYNVRFSVWIPGTRAAACLATIANTAENMQLSCHVEGMLNQPA